MAEPWHPGSIHDDRCRSTSSAQTSKGIIAGVVRDQSGAVIPKANITVTSQETGETRSLVADDLGTFV